APGPFLNGALAPDDRRLADLDLDTEGGAEPGRVPGTKRIVEVMTDPPERLILLAGAVLEPFRHAELGDAAPENRISAFGLSQIFDQRSVEIARCSRCPQREVAMRRDLIGGHRDWCDDCQDQQEVERGRPHCRFSRRRGVRPSRSRAGMTMRPSVSLSISSTSWNRRSGCGQPAVFSSHRASTTTPSRGWPVSASTICALQGPAAPAGQASTARATRPAATTTSVK